MAIFVNTLAHKNINICKAYRTKVCAEYKLQPEIHVGVCKVITHEHKTHLHTPKLVI